MVKVNVNNYIKFIASGPFMLLFVYDVSTGYDLITDELLNLLTHYPIEDEISLQLN